jgi:D-alanyl-D-alanine carboxypeptidase/D-alanyl-D-alanine-endopeptidase (penicillin-binding protein 4)
MFAVLTLSLLTLFPPAAVAQRKPRPPKERADVVKFRLRVEAALADAKAERGYWGVLVADAKTGEQLYALNAGKFFTPASNTKLYTTIIALSLLGPDYRFRTTLESRGTLDRFGRLPGDLVLVARGDPNLSSRKFPYVLKAEFDGPPERVLSELADTFAARGVKQIEGDIVVDDSYYPFERYPSGWAIDDMTFGYGAPVSALCLNDNTLNIEVRSADRTGDPAWFNAEPWADFYDFENRVRTVEAGGVTRVSLDREPGSRRVILRGTIALGAEPQLESLAIEEPAEYSAALLKRLLEARGVRILGRARARHATEDESAPADSGAIVLAEHTSVALIEGVRLVNKISQNLHAELLLRAVGKEKGENASVSASLRVAQEFFKSLGITEGDVAIYDGSGLSRRNLITPRATVKLLQYAAQQPWAAQFIDGLPVSAQDGTLERRMKDTSAAGRIRAKTGSLGNVNALSGFATTVHGTELVFSMFGNAHGLRGRDSTSVLDAICIAMVEELGAPPPGKKKRR